MAILMTSEVYIDNNWRRINIVLSLFFQYGIWVPYKYLRRLYRPLFLTHFIINILHLIDISFFYLPKDEGYIHG